MHKSINVRLAAVAALALLTCVSASAQKKKSVTSLRTILFSDSQKDDYLGMGL